MNRERTSMRLPTRLLVTGATGTVGRRLVNAFPNARVLSRDPGHAASLLDDVDVRPWDGRAPLDLAVFDEIDTVVHLAGEPIAGARWTRAQKDRIRESRVLGTRALVSSLRGSAARPSLLVCASAVGFYGDRGDEMLDEDSERGVGFLADVCASWEAEAMAAADLGVRVVRLRLGVVLDARGGALPKIALPFKLGLGGPIGSGDQWMPWIHASDVVRLVGHAMRRVDLEGPVNAVAPTPVRNREFAEALGAVLERPFRLRTPPFVIRAALGEAAEVVLGSQHVLPGAAFRSGFRFQFSMVSDALTDLLGVHQMKEATRVQLS